MVPPSDLPSEAPTRPFEELTYQQAPANDFTFKFRLPHLIQRRKPSFSSHHVPLAPNSQPWPNFQVAARLRYLSYADQIIFSSLPGKTRPRRPHNPPPLHVLPLWKLGPYRFYPPNNLPAHVLTASLIGQLPHSLPPSLATSQVAGINRQGSALPAPALTSIVLAKKQRGES